MVCLKLLIQQHWIYNNKNQNNFLLNNEDKATIRDSVIDGLIQVIDFPKIR